MGYQYASTAITPELDDSENADSANTTSSSDAYRPAAAPGCRAPHVWVDRAHDISTIDLIGPDLTLLTAPAGRPWRDAAASATRHFGSPVAQPVVDVPEWPAAYGVEPTGAVLVRPDGHVAWRRRRLPDTAGTDIDHELRAAIARSRQNVSA
jgi:tetracenomycin A2 monooxygenase-dioxygenase